MTSKPNSIIDECLALYRGHDYFVRRPIGENAPREYWDAKTDPDGKVRDIENEREVRIKDLRYIADYINALPPGRVLDIGCGLGELLQQLDGHHQTFGLDTSARSIEVCRRHTKADLRMGVLDGAFQASNLFSAIVAHHVIEHVPDPIAFVLEVHRLLEPDGVFVCGTPDFSSAAARRFGDRFRLLHDPTHVSLFTEDSLLRLLRDHGFIIDAVEKPFFDTRFATRDTFDKMQHADGDVSPAFYGSFLTVFARKRLP